MRFSRQCLIVLVAGSIAACSDGKTTTASTSSLAAILNAYNLTPAGYANVTSSYSADSNAVGPFEPRMGPRGPGGPGGPPPGPGFGEEMMGGGLGGPFLGDGLDFGFGPGRFGNGALPSTCTYASGIVTCPPLTIGGLTITRTAEYTNAAGTPQSSVDSTTNTIATQIRVTGTVTTHDSATTTVNEQSSQTVSGLAKGSTQRTVNGTSTGNESTTGTTPAGAAFTSIRTIGDTITGLVLPVPTLGTPPTYPTAGTVVRDMSISMTSGGTTTTSSRREVVTYNGTATATVVITQDGTTQNCTLPLPHGMLTCQ